MSSLDAYSSKRSALTKQSNSHIAGGSASELMEDDEEALEIEQTEQSEEMVEWRDLLGLEAACAGVLLTLWCELTSYARTYAVPKSVLRAMVQCSFLAELDRGAFWAEFEEDPKPLTREKYLEVLKQAERREAVRVQNAKYPYRVPEAKWREMLSKAMAGTEAGSADGK